MELEQIRDLARILSKSDNQSDNILSIVLSAYIVSCSAGLSQEFASVCANYSKAIIYNAEYKNWIDKG